MLDERLRDQVHPLSSLGPSGERDRRDLDEALLDIQAALDAGQTLSSILSGTPPGVFGDLQPPFEPEQRLALDLSGSVLPFRDAGSEHSDRQSRVLVSARASPLTGANPLAPAWTQGLGARFSRGPFLTPSGVPIWVDTFVLPASVSIVTQAEPQGAPRFLARLPLGRRPEASRSLSLAPGSLWLAARALVPDRPPNEFIGLKVRGGSIQLVGLQGATGSVITLGPDWGLVLQLELDPPEPAVFVDGAGIDAVRASVTLPERVTIRLRQSELPSVDLSEARASAYGASLDLTRSEVAPFYDAVANAVVVPCASSTDRFGPFESKSRLWTVADTSPIQRNGWAVPVTVSVPDALGEAAGAGLLWLRLGASIGARWQGLEKPAPLTEPTLGFAPGQISTWGLLKPAEARVRLALWDEAPSDPQRQSSIDFESAAGSTLSYVSQPGAESILIEGRARGHLDRPLQADGGRVTIDMATSWFALAETASGTTAAVLGSNPGSTRSPHISFALSNAIIKTRPPSVLFASGPFDADRIEAGFLLLNLPHRALLPTLPDPYAANFGFDRRQDFDSGFLSARVDWSTPDTPELTFALRPDQNASTPTPSGDLAAFTPALFARGGPRLDGARVLLDVSSKADQFGVAIPLRSQSLRVEGLSLVAEASEAAVVTLPPISWEPMITKAPASGSGDVPLPPPPHDGGPAILLTHSKDTRRVEPIPLLAGQHEDIGSDRHFVARLPLPFGLIAQVQSHLASGATETSDFIAGGGAVFLNRPSFPNGRAGGLQLALVGRPNGKPDSRDPTLPGHVELRNEGDYARGVLSTNIHTRFGGDFGLGSPNGVPLRRYELSGYGASLLSDWRDPEAVGPAIIEARFDVLVGRTAHEVIQMQSVLYPWFIRVVRTITIERKPGGWILREDSGWVAAGDGRFDYVGDPGGLPPVPEAFPAPRRHLGTVEALTKVQNIRLAGPQFPIPARGAGQASTVWQPVRFDADVLFRRSDKPRLVVGAGSSLDRTPSKGISGWIQIDGPTYTAQSANGGTVLRVRPADGQQVFDLLLVEGPAQAPVDCVLALGGDAPDRPGSSFRVNRVDVGCNDDPNNPHLVAAARGSALLPRDGAWTFARIGAGDSAPKALDPTFPIPIVGPNSFQPGFGRWHFADPADITRLGDAASPATVYGIVQGLGTQKIFFARPRVGNEPEPITLPKPPQLADMGALLHAVGAFPGLGEAFDFKALKSLSVDAGEIGFAETFVIGAKGATKEATLIDLGGSDALQVLIEYHDENGEPTVASIEVNPSASPRWSLSLKRTCFAVRFKGKPLISIFAALEGDEHKAPSVTDLQVRYEGILNALQSLFSNIQQVARFLPGGAGAGLKIGFSQGRLTVRNVFAVPNLPLGAGQITDVAVNMGFDVALSPVDVTFVAGLGSQQSPFRWIVSPLAGTGVVQVGISTQGLDVLVQGGLGLGLAIDLGIASGSASIALAVELNTGPDPFEIRGILSGRASVDVLAGLASATITLAAGLGIIPPPQLFAPPFLPPQLLPPPDEIPELTVGLTASVSVGIHISVCWVVDVDWDGYWQFRQDITTPAIPIPL